MGWFSSADGKAAMARTEDLRAKGRRTPDEERASFLGLFRGRS